MDDKLVERVCRAICAANKVIADRYFTKRGERKYQWQVFEPDARAAIAVCRAAVVEECARIAERTASPATVAAIRALAKETKL